MGHRGSRVVHIYYERVRVSNFDGVKKICTAFNMPVPPAVPGLKTMVRRLPL